MFKIAKLIDGFAIITQDSKKILIGPSIFDESRMFDSFVDIADSIIFSSGCCRWKQDMQPKVYVTLDEAIIDLEKLNDFVQYIN